MQLDLWTLAIQAVNFLVLVWLLSRLLFRPVRQILQKRQALYQEHMQQAEKKAEQAEAAKADYDARTAALEAERNRKAAETHKALQAERDEILQEARAAADEMRDEARKQIAEERERALAAAKDQIAGLVSDLTRRILADAALDSTGPALLARLRAVLDDLPPDRAATLRADLAPADAQWRVITAAPIPDDRRRTWADTLRRQLGTETDPQFDVDSDLLGGVVLHLPHQVLDLSWARKLELAIERIREAGDEP